MIANLGIMAQRENCPKVCEELAKIKARITGMRLNVENMLG